MCPSLLCDLSGGEVVVLHAAKKLAADNLMVTMLIAYCGRRLERRFYE